jgi:hypothetical protein
MTIENLHQHRNTELSGPKMEDYNTTTLTNNIIQNSDNWFERQVSDPVLAEKIRAIDQEAEMIMKASVKYI